MDKIDEKNVELVTLKRQVAKFNQTLNYYKDQLQMALEDLADIQKRIAKQDMLFEYTQRELSAANYEQNRAAKKHTHLVEQTQSFYVPEILDYVRKKALLFNLQRDCDVWQRKVELVSVNILMENFLRYFLYFYRWVFNNRDRTGKQYNEMLDMPIIRLIRMMNLKKNSVNRSFSKAIENMNKEKKKKKKRTVRWPGVEPGSAAWKATMLTVTPPTLVNHLKNRSSLTFLPLRGVDYRR